MCQPYIGSATALSDIDDEEPQEFRFLSGGRNGLPALTWSVDLKYDVPCL